MTASTLPADVIRTDVMRAMHYSGDLYGRVPEADWTTAYLLADGFGRLTGRQAADQCWDWSHVRDSSPEALARMHAFLWGVLGFTAEVGGYAANSDAVMCG